MGKRYIDIPNLKKLKPDDKFLGKDLYSVYEVHQFFLEDDSLCYFKDKKGACKGKMRCVKRYQDKYKIFAYKTSGRLSHTKYFILDLNSQEISLAGSGETLSFLNDWIEYLMDGGTLEKALINNRDKYDPSEGI